MQRSEGALEGPLAGRQCWLAAGLTGLLQAGSGRSQGGERPHLAYLARCREAGSASADLAILRQLAGL